MSNDKSNDKSDPVLDKLIAEVWQEILDKDDRNSPEEYPEMVMITYEEFADYMQRASSGSARGERS
jgi:hypothetical protein